MEEWISYRKYADRRGVSDTTIRSMIKENRITKECIDYSNPARPKINPRLADKCLSKSMSTLSNSRQTRSDLGRTKKPEPEPKATAKEILKPYKSNKQIEVEAALLVEEMELDAMREDGMDLPGIDINADPVDGFAAREQKLIYEAIEQKLKVFKIRGQLVDKDDVNMVLGGLAAALKQDILAIPRNVASNVMSCKTAFDVEQLLYRELESIFADHSDIRVTEKRLRVIKRG